MSEVVLVAGRGPLAVRAVRSCRAAGAKVVTVYSEADANALHVREADESVLIGAAPPESSYLDPAALIEAARVSNAHAVLPVHAVLAGSSDLAHATIDAGLLWIGPDPHALASAEGAGVGQTAPAVPASPGWVIGLADAHRIDGLVVRRTRAAGARLCWTSAEEPDGLAVDGLPTAALLLAMASDLAIELGWQGLLSVAFDPDGSPVSVRGGLPADLGLVELRAGRDLVQSAIALADGSTPPPGAPGVPAAVGGSVRATAVPGAGQRATIGEFTGPTGDSVRWDPGYEVDDSLWPWYDPILATVAVGGGDLASAVSAFLGATSAIRVAGVPTDLDQLRARAGDLAARLDDGAS